MKNYMGDHLCTVKGFTNRKVPGENGAPSKFYRYATKKFVELLRGVHG